jgi:hypothetical protein
MTPDEKLQALAKLVSAIEQRCRRLGQLLTLAVVGLLAVLVGVVCFGKYLGLPSSAASSSTEQVNTKQLTAHEIIVTDEKGQPVARLKGHMLGLMQLTRPDTGNPSYDSINVSVGGQSTGFELSGGGSVRRFNLLHD